MAIDASGVETGGTIGTNSASELESGPVPEKPRAIRISGVNLSDDEKKLVMDHYDKVLKDAQQNPPATSKPRSVVDIVSSLFNKKIQP